MLARRRLIQIHRDLYRRLRVSSRDYLGLPGSELQEYFSDYQREFRNFGEISSKKELLDALLHTQIALCGDYHTLGHSQKTVLELLAELEPRLKARGLRLVLALEMLPHRRTEDASQFLTGKMSEAKFLDRIGFEKNWGFDWRNYEGFFKFAKDFGISIVGLNGPDIKGKAPLTARDKFFARVISDIRNEPDTFVFALVGDLHLAQSHLPRELQENPFVVIHQNEDSVYWKLAEKKLEHRVDVVRLRENAFCVVNTPPWVKLQSLVSWGETTAENGESVPCDDQMAEFVGMLCGFLGLGPVTLDFEIVGPHHRAYVEKSLKTKGVGDYTWRLTLAATKKFPSLFIPLKNFAFVKDSEVDQVAHQAASFVYAKKSGFKRLFSSPQEDFYCFLWMEVLSFFGSKVINPKRKPISAIGSFEKDLPAHCSSIEFALSFLENAKALGQRLGSAMFEAVMDGAVAREVIADLFGETLDSKKAELRFLEWSERLKVS